LNRTEKSSQDKAKLLMEEFDDGDVIYVDLNKKGIMLKSSKEEFFDKTAQITKNIRVKKSLDKYKKKAKMLMDEFDAGEDINLDLNKEGMVLKSNTKKLWKLNYTKSEGKTSNANGKIKSKYTLKHKKSKNNYGQVRYVSDEPGMKNENAVKMKKIINDEYSVDPSKSLANLSQLQSYLLETKSTLEEQPFNQNAPFYSLTKKEIKKQSKVSSTYFQLQLYRASIAKCFD